jgi:hypothetical protein
MTARDVIALLTLTVHTFQNKILSLVITTLNNLLHLTEVTGTRKSCPENPYFFDLNRLI